MTPTKINLGGGMHWSMEGWANLDRASTGYDISTQLLSPFTNESMDLVYSSHNIEHFPFTFAPVYVGEIYRVLKRGGTVRMCIPDCDVMWEMLRDNDKSKLLYNTNYYVGEKASRDVLHDVRELFGWTADLNDPKFLVGTMHNAFFNKSIIGVFLYNAGFRDIVFKDGPNDSDIPDFKQESQFDGGKYISGFDNKPLGPISLYVEATK